MKRIGILHPGEMGVSVAASAIHNGHQVYWTSEGRSKETRRRAQKHKLMEVKSLTELCQTCELIISVCPPHVALYVAQSVIQTGFKGSYLDANAISHQQSIHIGSALETAGIDYVDGGIIGGPAWSPKETYLYLAGEHAEDIAACFSNGPLETKILGNEIGKASALKMCYAAYSKGTTALLASILATAENLGVRQNLYEQWNADEPGFSDQVDLRVTRVTAKAWRFEGEMREISATFQEAGLPSGFHEAAAQVYQRIANLKDRASAVSIVEVLAKLAIQKD